MGVGVSPPNGPHARLRSDLSDSDDVDVRLANLEDAPPAVEAEDTLKRICRIRQELDWGKLRCDSARFDLAATAAVLSLTVLSPAWLRRAVDATRRKGTAVNQTKYFEGCLRNGVAETEGLCRQAEVYDVYGRLWRWARPAVAAAARAVREQHQPSEKG